MRLDSLLTSILPMPLTVSALLLCLASALVLGILTARCSRAAAGTPRPSR